ncbi:ATP-binding protein [Verrucomicrobiota bacterium]
MEPKNVLRIEKEFYLTPKHTKRAIVLLMTARTPVALIGGVGIGKTTLIYDVIKDLNKMEPNVPKPPGEWKLWLSILSLCESTDIGGIPYPGKNGRVDYLMAKDLPFDCVDRGILCCDEYDRAKEDVQNASLQLMLGGNIHGHKLSPNVFPVIAMNGESDIYTTPLSNAAITRMCTLFISHSADGALDSYIEWAEQNKISPMMRGFAAFRPELIKTDNSFKELAIPTPRTRDMADRILRAAESVAFETDDIIMPCLAGVIGRAAAVELLAYKEAWKEIVPITEIIKDPKNAKIPDNVSVLYGLAAAMSDHIPKESDTGQVNIIDKLTDYIVRMPPELAAFAFRCIGRKCGKLETNTVYLKWRKQHKVILEV